MKRESECYWFGADCRRGHLVGCPVSEFQLDPANPWDERTKPGATPLPAAEEDDLIPRPIKTTWKMDSLGRWCMDA